MASPFMYEPKIHTCMFPDRLFFQKQRDTFAKEKQTDFIT